MARPPKNNCDYFPHDAGMRNHKKVKAIRSKFGIIGYGIWSMLLEHLTGNDGNVFEYSDLELELMAGDFGVSATEIRDVVDYCIKLEMLFLKDGFINSESLDERLLPVYQKRGKSKELSKKQQRVNGKYVTEMPQGTGVSVTEMPQSKVKERKLNNIDKDLCFSDAQQAFEEMTNDSLLIEHVQMGIRYNWQSATKEDVFKLIRKFLVLTVPGGGLDKAKPEVKKHLMNWINSKGKKIHMEI